MSRSAYSSGAPATAARASERVGARRRRPQQQHARVLAAVCQKLCSEGRGRGAGVVTCSHAAFSIAPTASRLVGLRIRVWTSAVRRGVRAAWRASAAVGDVCASMSDRSRRRAARALEHFSPRPTLRARSASAASPSSHARGRPVANHSCRQLRSASPRVLPSATWKFTIMSSSSDSDYLDLNVGGRRFTRRAGLPHLHSMLARMFEEGRNSGWRATPRTRCSSTGRSYFAPLNYLRHGELVIARASTRPAVRGGQVLWLDDCAAPLAPERRARGALPTLCAAERAVGRRQVAAPLDGGSLITGGVDGGCTLWRPAPPAEGDGGDGDGDGGGEREPRLERRISRPPAT